LRPVRVQGQVSGVGESVIHPCKDCGHGLSDHADIKTERFNRGDWSNHDEGGRITAKCKICQSTCESFAW
jgi:hypothetical protein